MPPAVPDIVILAAKWRPRALIRAQLIEEGFDVVATGTWPMMRRHLRPGRKPQLVIVDLEELPEPADVTSNLRVLMPANRVLVITAIATLAVADLERLGFRTISRPLTISQVVEAAVKAIRAVSSAPASGKDARQASVRGPKR